MVASLDTGYEGACMAPSALRQARRPGEDETGPHSPEGLVISALLESGMFTPEIYFLSEEHLSCYQKLWRFCVDYQSHTGSAPPLSLVRERFPDFTFSADIDASWATSELHRAASARHLRAQTREALTALNEYDDVEAAFTALEALQRPRTNRKPPTSFLDHSLLEEEENVLTIDVPYHALSAVAGGIRSGEYWTMAARPGIGKSSIASWYLRAAVQAGFRVRWYTLEMPKRQVARRVWRTLAFRDPELRKQLDSEDIFERKTALDILKDRLPVVPEIVDRKDGPITLDTIREGLREVDLVILDPVGLLKSSAGTRMSEDSRLMGATSNQLREDVLATDSSLLSIHHINRVGESYERCPGLRDLAESDWIGRDSDAVITLTRYKREDAAVMMHYAAKVREGATTKWLSRYDPRNGRYEQISQELADEIDILTADRNH